MNVVLVCVFAFKEKRLCESVELLHGQIRVPRNFKIAIWMPNFLYANNKDSKFSFISKRCSNRKYVTAKRGSV